MSSSNNNNNNNNHDDLSAFEISPSVAPAGLSSDGFLVLDPVRARTADFLAQEVPASASPWSVFPAWVQEALKVVFNDLKNHYQESVSAKKQIEKLEAYHASSSWPQFVLHAVPGTSSFSVDNSVVSEDERSAMLNNIHLAIESARRVVFDQALSAKKLAWQRHHDLADASRALRSLRCRFFQNLTAMGLTGDSQNPYLGLLSRALSHLNHMISDLEMKTRWAAVSVARAKEKSDASRSAADIVMSDTQVATKSVEKLVDEKLAKKLQSLGLSGKGRRPRVLGSAQGRIRKGAKAPSKPANKPAAKHNNNNNNNKRRLAPAPTPFKSLKKAKNPSSPSKKKK